jgi:hypothetical protein
MSPASRSPQDDDRIRILDYHASRRREFPSRRGVAGIFPDSIQNEYRQRREQHGLATPPPGRAIKPDRGRKTYAALVETGFQLLESRDFESISIAELARSAGYSIGAFYARFDSKDEFFHALTARHLAA